MDDGDTEESVKFNASTQMSLILKKGWFSDLVILEICGQVNHEEYT